MDTCRHEQPGRASRRPRRGRRGPARRHPERRRPARLPGLVATLFLAAGLSPALADAPPHSVEPLTFRTGDDLAWAAPTLQDAGEWSAERPRGPGNWWIRTRVVLRRDSAPTADLALRVHAAGALEVYWDGLRIGGDGTIGHDGASETPGRHGVWVALPPNLATAGGHVVAVRVSSHRTGRIRGPIEVRLLDRAQTERREGARTAFFLFCAGALLVCGLVFGLLRTPVGRADSRLLAALTVLVGLLLLLEYAKYVYPYPYPWHFPRLIAISSLTILVGLLLPLFVQQHLRLSGRTLLLASLSVVYVATTIVQTDPDDHSLTILRLAIGVSFALAAAGAFLGRQGSRAVLLACATHLLPGLFTGFRFADRWFFLGFLAMVGVLLIEMARTLRRRAVERQAALSAVDRLRYQLVRRTIQPHFLMNSLAVAIGDIEEDPARGIAFVRDLARELQAFLHLTDRDTVPWSDELELCEMHVRTMEHLLDRPIGFHVDGPVPSSEIPPGVLLTLVENAITHGHHEADRPIRVTFETRDDRTVVEVVNAVAADAAPPGAEGAGLRFVRAQIARDPAAAWTLDCGVSDGAWHARLERSCRPGAQARRSLSAP